MDVLGLPGNVPHAEALALYMVARPINLLLPEV